MSRRRARYYAAAGDDPRDTLLDALARFDEPGLAADLGCGNGRDTVGLLRRGWRVIAIDGQAQGIELLRARTGDDPRLETQDASYEDATWPQVDLLNASWSVEEDSQSATGEPKHRHVFHVVVRRP